MKIGMLLDEEFPPDPRVENEALTLIAAGHEVHLYCLGPGENSNQREEYKGIQVYRYAVPTVLRSISALAYTLPFYHIYLRNSVRDFIAASRVDVLHIHDIRIARTLFWCNKKLNLPVTLDLHENRPEIMKFYAHVRSGVGRWLIYPSWWKRWEFRFIRKADHVVVVTESAKEYYIAQTGKAAEYITVVPNTVRRAFYENPVVDQSIVDRYKEDFVILYLGDTGLRRGLMTAIEGMPAILTQIPNARLVIVGSSRDDEVLRSYVQEQGVADHVDQLGWQEFELFPSYILASHIGICPLHRNLHHDTTYANKVFQYLAFGKPVVVSDSTAQARVVEKYDCGEVFPDRDTDAYVAKILKLNRDSAHYARLAQNASQAIETNLRWEVYAKSLVGLYQDVQR